MTKISFIETENRVMNFNFRSMWENKIGPALVWLSNVLSWGLQFIACIILTVAIFGVALPLMYAFWLNPLAFALWAHIFPKLEAQLFFERPMDEKQPNNMVDAWGTICVGIICWGHRKLHGWMPRYFAWYAKRAFINEEPTAFSTHDVERYLRTLTDDEKVSFFDTLLTMDNGYEWRNAKKLTLQKELWAMNDMWLRIPFLKAKVEKREKLNIEELQFICDSANYGLLDAYMKSLTLSEDMLKVMIASHDDSIRARVAEHIKKNGLSAEFTAWAYVQEDKGISKLVDQNLEIYSQIQFTNQLRNSAGQWTAYCRETKHFFTEAEKLFDAFQAKSFYANGHKEMSEEAIFHFFTLATKEKNDVADVIFKNEGIRALKSERIKTLVKTNYWLNCHALGMA